MKPHVKEFLAEQEAVGAARSKEAKRKHLRKISERLRLYIVAKAERMEANGNIAGAEAYRNFWRSFPEYGNIFPKTEPDK